MPVLPDAQGRPGPEGDSMFILAGSGVADCHRSEAKMNFVSPFATGTSSKLMPWSLTLLAALMSSHSNLSSCVVAPVRQVYKPCARP
jgi:hypothetical protein